MDDELKFFKDFISSPPDNNASVDESKELFYYIKGMSNKFRFLQTDEYTWALTLAAFYGKKGDLVDEALLFIEKEYPQYIEWVKYDFLNKSTLLYQWASLLEAKGRHHEALEKVKKATLYNLTDNIGYTNYEFLSFRGCAKYVFSEIADETLSLMNPSEFNDPMDTVLLQWIDNQIKIGVSGFELQKEALKNLRVRCFSRSARLPRGDSPEEILKLRKQQKQDVCKISPLMWAHYADYHKGICLKYSFKSEQLPLINDDHTEILRIGNIDYKPKFSVNELEIRVWDALFAKSKVWQYEHETRLVYYSTNDVPKVKKIKVPGAITGIYLGLRCSEEDERIIRALVNGRNIPVYRMFTDINDVYKLKAKLITD